MSVTSFPLQRSNQERSPAGYRVLLPPASLADGGLRNSLRSNSPRPLSAFSLAPGSPIKAGLSCASHKMWLACRTTEGRNDMGRGE